MSRKTVFAEFEVTDVLDNQDTAMHLEIRFKGADDSATVWDENPMIDEVKGKREQLARLALNKMFGFDFEGESLCDEADSVFHRANPRILNAVAFADSIIELLTAKPAEPELPMIHSDDDWLELGIDERGEIVGKLDSSITPDSTGITLSLADWSLMYIQVGETTVYSLDKGTKVRATVARNEDGIVLVDLKLEREA